MNIGTCSLCGGEVHIPELWSGLVPPSPTCRRCRAVAVNRGPVIPMKRIDNGGASYSGWGKPEATYDPHRQMKTWGKE